jgi:Zn-dependent protease
MRPEDSFRTMQIAASLIVIFFAIGIHEYAHCKLADAAGDPTPRYYGRVTLNLFKHFDPLGSIMIVITTLSGFGIGWGKPAPMDPRKMRNPRWDFFMAVAAGPISNFLQAVVFALIFRLIIRSAPQLMVTPLLRPSFLGILIIMGVYINLGLMFFNLIPLGPLDGHWLVGLLMPEKQRHYWNRWNLQYGMFALFGLILLGNLTQFDPIGQVLEPLVMKTAGVMFGVHF